MTTNENGLTWERWYAAATLGLRFAPEPTKLRRMEADWRSGCCPCDWAAHWPR